MCLLSCIHRQHFPPLTLHSLLTHPFHPALSPLSLHLFLLSLLHLSSSLPLSPSLHLFVLHSFYTLLSPVSLHLPLYLSLSLWRSTLLTASLDSSSRLHCGWDRPPLTYHHCGSPVPPSAVRTLQGRPRPTLHQCPRARYAMNTATASPTSIPY